MQVLQQLLGAPKSRPFGVPRINHASWQSKGLVFWMPGLDLSGRDYSVYKRPGTLNAATLLATKPSTKLSQGVGRVLEGTVDNTELIIYENTLNEAVLNFGLADPFTLSLWFHNVNAAFAGGALLAKAGATGGDRQYQIYSSSNESYATVIHGTTSTGVASSLVNNRDYFITVTKSGAEATDDVSRYLDGLFVSTSTAGTSTAVNADLCVGARKADDSNGATAFQMNDGEQIWDARIYNYELNAAQVWALYDPVARWDLYQRPLIQIPGLAVVAAAGGEDEALWIGQQQPIIEVPAAVAY